jgi:N-acetylglucosamine-6-phosphate deacetylase
MSKRTLRGRHYSTGEWIEVQCDHRFITAINPGPGAASTAGPWIAPGLVDLQVNGFGGVDFQQDNLTTEELSAATRALRAAGCTRWLLTLITDDWSRLLARLRHLKKLRDASPELLRAIAGWHIEGPFLSAEPGFCGAHDPTLMRDASPEGIRALREISGADPLLITLAPERNGALEAITQAKALGIKVSLGHTNASSRALRDAVARGAAGFTHLANGCPRELDRHDNILWRVLDEPDLMISLIPDGIHISPALFRLIHKLKPPEKIYYTADAMSAAGMGPGGYRLGRLELEVGADQVVRQPGRTNFAGSALRPVDGVWRAAGMLGVPWQETWRRFSEAPARFMGLGSGLEVGQPAEICLLEVDANGSLQRLTIG